MKTGYKNKKYAFRRYKTASELLIATLLTAVLTVGCNKLKLGAPPNQNSVGAGDSFSSPITSPVTSPTTTPATPSGQGGVRKSCRSSDPQKQCIGLKIVSYVNSNGTSVLNENDAEILTEQMDAIWRVCNIGFQLETYEAVNPITVGLSYNPNWRSESTQIRSAFSDQQTFLVVAVGSLGGSTIAVTQMPGYGPFGTLVESAYASNPKTVGHELGHYMGLYHIRNSSNLMNPYIGPNTEQLSQSQCATARATITQSWQHMMR